MKAVPVLVDANGEVSHVMMSSEATGKEVLEAFGAKSGAQLYLYNIPIRRPLNDLGVRPGEVREVRIVPGGDLSFLRRR